VAKLLNKNLLLRVVSAFVYLLLLAVSFVNKYTFFVVFSTFLMICMWEFYGLTEKIGTRPKKWFGMILAGLIFLVFFMLQFFEISKISVYVLILIAFVSFAVELLRNGNAIKNLSAEFLGIFYVAIPFALTNFLVSWSGKFDFRLLLGVFVIIWAYDIFAFFIGSSIGKRKIFPTISPNKTLEGTAGGIIFSIIAGIVVYKVFCIFSLIDWIIIAGLVAFGALIGDLIESKLKRSAGVKDSGKLMPGHGGLLDRFDSFLFAVVGAVLYLSILIF